MKTQEKITMKRIEKIENELEKVRKENKKMEFTNQMHGLLNGEEMPNSRHPEDLNDLCYVINKNLNLINDGIKAKIHEEGSTLNAPQTTVAPMDPGGTSFDMSWAPLLAPVDAPVLSEIPRLVPSIVPSESSFERPMAPLNLVPNVTPTSMVSSSSSSQRYLEMAYPILSTTMAYPMPSPMITPTTSNLVFPPTAPQIDPSMNIPSMSASVPMENNVNSLFGFPWSPSFSELISLNDDEIMTLLDDTSFDIN
ncbi:hypothetical protein H5410_004268 [Solanum commersonii]|uniref:Uncharacterized protein n=1 Tax=Solanum commersonii TaxID=4109 RepID=A0A9J6B811_SOLCO|nr:hypothetical protein H5410_004268 [Solanum commersonii]